MNANAQTPAEIFAKNPHLNMLCVEMGHAYGTARFESRCPLTGASINYNEPIRRVRIALRDGREFEGYIANRVFADLEFAGSYGDDAWGGSRWSLTPPAEWLAALDGAIRVSVLKYAPGAYANEKKSWTRESLTDGWRGTSYSKSTSKQLAANIARGSNCIAWRTETPRIPAGR